MDNVVPLNVHTFLLKGKTKPSNGHYNWKVVRPQKNPNI